MLKILLVEDEIPVRTLTKVKLRDQYEILEASNGEEALELIDSCKVDLMIVDIMMPQMNGYEFVQEIRQAGDMTPVIMLTAMNTFAHKKEGFAKGIDDYLTKPIDYEELKWRIEALLRRARIANEKKIQIGDLTLEMDALHIDIGGERVELTNIESKLLYKFLSYPDTVFTKQQLMDDIWGY
ncbi:MAG: response regulator transcription factor, partial [Eubacterium sp.]|nr:response regulator transcription factor [Eubacterium sp.]